MLYVYVLLIAASLSQIVGFADTLTFKPNIVIFLADDLGYGDVGVFGNTTIRTPNIDAIAKDGIQMTHHLTAASVCTPSRAALLTGRYPVRSGMYPTGIIRVNIAAASRCGLRLNETTLADIAKEVGYKTALIGKWHLGLNRDYQGDHVYHPRRRGFDYYYGHILTNLKDFGGEKGESVVTSHVPNIYLICLAIIIVGILTLVFAFKINLIGKFQFFLLIIFTFLSVGYWVFFLRNLIWLNGLLYRDFELVEQPINLETLSYRYTQEGIRFLEKREKDNNPFLLIMSWDHVHSALRTMKEFRGKSKHGRYGDAIEEMDSGVGDIMMALDRFGFGRNTIVYFTSDNGAHLEEVGVNGEIDGGSNGILKGGKTQGVVDGGIRVPSAVRFPGILPSGKVLDEPTMQMDMFTTFVNLIGGKLPKNSAIDGKNILPLLKFKDTVPPNEFFFHYCGDKLQAVRYRPRTEKVVWKLLFATPNYKPGEDKCRFVCSCTDVIHHDPPLLYDMTTDPGERSPLDLTSNSKLQKIVEKMTLAMNEHLQSVGETESQLSFYNQLWRPWLQPCCNFPSCTCSDPVYSNLIS